MTLLFDIGNTAIKIGKSENKKFSFLGRFYLSDYSVSTLKSILEEVNNIDSIYVSSVIPSFNKKIAKDLSKLFKVEPVFVSSTFKSNIKVNIDKKEELGADLFCDLVGAQNLYGNELAIIDLGTASKILFLDKEGVFDSCAIFLGYKQSLKCLANSTALLPEVDYFTIKNISDCHNTVDVINASAFYSQRDTIDGIIARYEKEKKCSLKRVFTGGNASNFVKKEEILDEYLTLKGLAILSERE